MSERRDDEVVPGQQADRLGALFDAHGDRLYRLARRLVSTADDALDLVQETFLRATKAAGSLPQGSKGEEAWLVRVLVNIRRDQWRREAVRKRHDRIQNAPSERHDPEGTYLTRATVWNALDSLPPRRRTVVVLAELDGLAIASIASLLGISAVTVRWHLSRGRRELARRLRVPLGEPNERSQESVAGRRPAPSRNPAP